MDYKSRRWKDLRASVLRRDGWLCRECRRYGRRREATVVHHAWPAELYPQYQWAAWCLVSLCHTCHNAMHVRHSDELTQRGMAWMRRCRPPESERLASDADASGIPPGVRFLDAPARGPVGGSISNRAGKLTERGSDYGGEAASN